MEEDAVDVGELEKFCRQFDCHKQGDGSCTFKAGSSVEIPNNEISMAPFGLNCDTQDYDCMLYATCNYVFPCGKSIPSGYRGIVCRIYTNGMHPGYAKLICGEGMTCKPMPHMRHFLNSATLPIHIRHGPALQFEPPNAAQFVKDNKLNMHMPTCILQDLTIAAHCPYWPLEASEWITRTRRYGCPSKSVIKKVARYGCDFVGVSHKLSLNYNNCTERRFSFSKAEVLIIRSWTSLKRIVYRVLRVIYKMIAQKKHGRNVNTVLCSYYFKTLMLWACEERPAEFWAEHALVQSIQQLLIEMTEWLIAKCCKNYFIPENNMMDHLADTDVSHDVSALLEACESEDCLAFAILNCSINEHGNENLKMSPSFAATLPCWLHSSLLIFDHINEFLEMKFNNQIANCSDRYPLELENAFFEHMAHIYRGIFNHAKASFCTNAKSKVQLIHRAERQFHLATRLNRSKSQTVSISKRILNSIRCSFVPYERVFCGMGQTPFTAKVKTDVSRVSTAKLNWKWLLYTRIGEPLSTVSTLPVESKPSHGNTSFTVFLSSKFLPLLVLELHREWPGLSPTVHVSWFIAKAYLANLYYAERYYEATIRTCNEVLKIYKASSGNNWFAENTFPVLLSTEWSGIFDKELQALLGLCSLAAFVWNRSDGCSVDISVSPIQFIHYLKVRSAMDQQQQLNIARFLKEYYGYLLHEKLGQGFGFGKEMLTSSLESLPGSKEFLAFGPIAKYKHILRATNLNVKGNLFANGC